MHHPDCDVNDPNIEGIRKPCNCPPGWSGAPTTDTAGPVGSLAMATGSLPASEAESLSQEWFALSLKSAARAREDEKLGRETGAWCNQARSEAYLLCADMLRQRAGLPTSRQPEENTQIS